MKLLGNGKPPRTKLGKHLVVSMENGAIILPGIEGWIFVNSRAAACALAIMLIGSGVHTTLATPVQSSAALSLQN